MVSAKTIFIPAKKDDVISLAIVGKIDFDF